MESRQSLILSKKNEMKNKINVCLIIPEDIDEEENYIKFIVILIISIEELFPGIIDSIFQDNNINDFFS